MHASHVVVDTRDGWTWARDASNQLLTQETAQEWCDRINAGMKPEHQTYQVFTLTPPPDPDAGRKTCSCGEAWADEPGHDDTIPDRADVATAVNARLDAVAAEVQAGPRFADMRQPGTEWPGHWRSL